MIKDNNNDVEKEQEIINEIYYMIEKVDEELKQTEDSTLEKEINGIEMTLESDNRIFFDKSSVENKDEQTKDRELIVKTVRSFLSNRYLNGVQRFLNISNSNDNNKLLEIYNELSCSHPKNSILGGFNNINNFNLKNVNKENYILYWIFGKMYEQKVLKNEANQAIALDSKYEKESLIEKGKQIIHFIKESLESIYIDLESIDFSNNKTQKYIPIIKNLKQGRIYLKNVTKNVDVRNKNIFILIYIF